MRLKVPEQEHVMVHLLVVEMVMQKVYELVNLKEQLSAVEMAM